MVDEHSIPESEGQDFLYKSFYHPDQPMDRRRRSGWIISFTDLMAILLSFFVLLFSMVAPSKNEWGMIAGSFEDEFKKLERQLTGYAGVDPATNINLLNEAAGENLDYVQTVLEGLLTRLPQETAKDIRISRQSDRIIIFAPVLLAFNKESAALSPNAQNMITRFAQILKSFDNKIEIVGQTAFDEGGANPQYLALQRAINVAQEFKRHGLKHNPVVLALGTQSAPKVTAQNQELSTVQQRVDIIILRERAQ
jgi:chemotaxis protein MotB